MIISLTSIPSRLPFLRPALLSLLHQDRPADEVVLALPEHSLRENSLYRLPEFLEQLPVRVLRCGRDWGPACKLIPVLQESAGDTLVLYVDDDNVYPADLVSTMLAWHQRFPQDALGYRGWRLPPSLDWHETVTRYGSGLDRPYPVDVLTATWGVLVRADFFDAAVFESHPDGFYVDDIWFSGHLARRGVERQLIPTRLAPLPTRSSSIFDLGSRENGDGRRNNRVIQAFREEWRR